MKSFGILAVLFAMAISMWLLLGHREPGQPGPTAAEAKHIEDRARDAVDQANLVQIQNAVATFQASKGRFPESLDELQKEGFVQQLPAGLAYDPASGKVSREP